MAVDVKLAWPLLVTHTSAGRSSNLGIGDSTSKSVSGIQTGTLPEAGLNRS